MCLLEVATMSSRHAGGSWSGVRRVGGNGKIKKTTVPRAQNLVL